MEEKMTCTFFGHRDTPENIKPKLEITIREQIIAGATEFYVGNHGNFDFMALLFLRNLKKEFPNIRYSIVLPYLPMQNDSYDCNETFLTECVECVPKRFAIDCRNRWMIDHSDTVITCVALS